MLLKVMVKLSNINVNSYKINFNKTLILTNIISVSYNSPYGDA